MKKRSLCLLLCLAFLLALLPANAMADAAEPVSGTNGEISYTITDADADGTLDTAVFTGTGNSTLTRTISEVALTNGIAVSHLVIGAGISSLPQRLFEGRSSLTDVQISNDVVSMGENVFFNCSNLSSVVLSSSLTSIEPYTFYSCSGLTEISLPDGITEIRNNAFERCSNLTSINFPANVTLIGNSAFSNCGSLSSVSLPDGLSTIGERAFEFCRSMTSIQVPESVTYIGTGAFVSGVGCVYYSGPYGEANDKWGAKERGQIYKIAYKCNAGTSDADVIVGVPAVGESVETPVAANPFHLTGLAFTGWNTQADGCGDSYPYGSTITISGDTSLYAQWIPGTTEVTFDANGGEFDPAFSGYTATYGVALPEFPTSATREGYTLTGYYTNDAGGVRVLDANGAALIGVPGYTDIYGRWACEDTALMLFAHWEWDQSFLITIPAELLLNTDGTGDMTLSCSSIVGCTVEITAASGNGWVLSQADQNIPYTLSLPADGGGYTALENGATAAFFAADAHDAVTLHAEITDFDSLTVLYAEDYQDTITFTCTAESTEFAAPAPEPEASPNP